MTLDTCGSGIIIYINNRYKQSPEGERDFLVKGGCHTDYPETTPGKNRALPYRFGTVQGTKSA